MDLGRGHAAIRGKSLSTLDDQSAEYTRPPKNERRPASIRPFGAQQCLRLGDGVEREIGADGCDDADRDVRPIAQPLLQERAQWLGAAGFFRGLRKDVFIEEALFGERAKEAE